MSAASDITRAGMVAHEAADRVRSAAGEVSDASRQLALNAESLQQERARWQDEVLAELRTVTGELRAGVAGLIELRRKAAEAAGGGPGIALAGDRAARSIPFNINHHVRVKVTEAGREALRDFYASFRLPVPASWLNTDADGYVREQLWVVMEVFGPHCGNGRELVIAPDILIEVPDAD